MLGNELDKGVTEQYDATNLELATLFAFDPDRYPGIQQEWADRVLSKATEADQTDCGLLFKEPTA